MKAAGFVPVLLISASVSALAIGVYDQTVRQPRTPRIAVVDIARLYAAAESQARSRLVTGATAAAISAAPAAQGQSGARMGAHSGAMLGPSVGGSAGSASGTAAMPPELATMREMSSFGPRLEGVLRQISTDCRCVIAAMAAVVGEVDSVPDYTHLAANRLGVTLPVTAAAPALPRQ